ncbi:MAG: sulfur carrier protein ThiS [Thermoanaerobaculia bacterium]
MSESLNIQLNGQPREVPAGSTLGDLISELGVDVNLLAVELNQKIVPRSELSGRGISEGDQIEIVEFVGGG